VLNFRKNTFHERFHILRWEVLNYVSHHSIQSLTKSGQFGKGISNVAYERDDLVIRQLYVVAIKLSAGDDWFGYGATYIRPIAS
jgi:hypothetical protein